MRAFKKTHLMLALAGSLYGWSTHAQDSFCKEYLSAAPAGIASAVHNMTESTDNKLILTGRTSGDVSQLDDFYLSRINPVNGNLLGFVQYGSGFDDRAFDCASTSDGGILTVGYGWQEMTERDRVLGGLPLNTGNSTFSMVKINSDGSLGWQRHMDIGDYDDMAFSMVKKTDGTFLVLGRQHGPAGKYLTLVHVNESGTILGTFSYNQIFVGGETLYGVDIIQAQDGGFYILAMDGYDFVNRNDPYEFRGLGSNCYVIKLDASLNYVFAKDISFSRPAFTVNRMMAYEITQASDGDLALVGYIRSESPGGGGPGLQFDAFLIELDALGNFKGSRYFDFAGTDRAIPMAIETIETGYVIAGTTTTQSFVHAVDNDLVTLGTSVLDPASSIETHAIFQRGNFFFFGGRQTSIALAKKKGNLINCCETPISVRSLEGIYSSVEEVPVGFSRVTESYTLAGNFTTVDFEESQVDNCVSMAPLLSTIEVDSPDFLKVYPNPVSKELQVSVSSYLTDDRIELRSISGKVIATRRVSGNVTTLNVGDLQTGTYILTYLSGAETRHEKVMIQR